MSPAHFSVAKIVLYQIHVLIGTINVNEIIQVMSCILFFLPVLKSIVYFIHVEVC